MKMYLSVNTNGVIHMLSLLNATDYSRLEIDGLFIIDAYKEHNHSYKFKAFFYNSGIIYSYRYFKTKSKLYSAIQLLLQEELSDVIQFRSGKAVNYDVQYRKDS